MTVISSWLDNCSALIYYLWRPPTTPDSFFLKNTHQWTLVCLWSSMATLSVRSLNNLIPPPPHLGLWWKSVYIQGRERDRDKQPEREAREKSDESISEWKTVRDKAGQRWKESTVVVVVLCCHYPPLLRAIRECCSREQKLAREVGRVM